MKHNTISRSLWFYVSQIAVKIRIFFSFLFLCLLFLNFRASRFKKYWPSIFYKHPRSTVRTAGTDCFLCFPATNPIYSVDFWSAPLNPDDFITTVFRSGFRRKNSGKFRKISTGIRWKLTKPIGTDRNLSDEIRTGIL